MAIEISCFSTIVSLIYYNTKIMKDFDIYKFFMTFFNIRAESDIKSVFGCYRIISDG